LEPAFLQLRLEEDGHYHLCESSEYASEYELEQLYTPEEVYQQQRTERKKAARAARREIAQRSAQRPAMSGVKPSPPPLPTKNRFGTLEEVAKPTKSYADYVKEQEQSRPCRAPRPKTSPSDAFSPVPGLDVALVPEKPGAEPKCL
jgi:hypothetical protein